MSILKNNPITISEPAMVAKQIANQAAMNYKQIVNMYEDGLRKFWKNNRATPQEISAELGTSAVEVFQLHGLLYTTIKTANPEEALTEVSTLGAFTVNQDGSITITRVGAATE